MTAAIKLTDTCSLEYKLWQMFFQSFSRVWLFVSSWTVACQASLSFTITQSLLKLMSIESVMLSNHLILCCPLLLLPSVFPSTRVFSIESALCIRWPKYWSFSFCISPSNDQSRLISFQVYWFDLLAVWENNRITASFNCQAVAETSTQETKHHTWRVGELRFIKPAGPEELTL